MANPSEPDQLLVFLGTTFLSFNHQIEAAIYSS